MQVFENINKLYTTAYLSADQIIGKLYVRNRRSGDKIFVNGMNKSLKKLFIEKKIPKEYRDTIPRFPFKITTIVIVIWKQPKCPSTDE